MPAEPGLRYSLCSVLSVMLLSASVIALQLGLMRALSLTRYYHFAYLVISTALLGFGASGTCLALTFEKLRRNLLQWSLLCYLFYLVAIPVCLTIAQRLPLDVQYIFYGGKQLALLLLHNLLVFVPFFFAAVIIGIALAVFRSQATIVYGANLLGSGIGGIGALALMLLVRPTDLPIKTTALACLAALLWMISNPACLSPRVRWHTLALGAAGTACLVVSLVAGPEPRIDQYKTLAHFLRLEQQGDATRIASRYGPRAQIDVYSSPSVHVTLFAGLGATALPPDQLSVLLDGQLAGSVFAIDRAEEAAIMDHTPQSVPYRLIEKPRVLLLGEVGGANVWLAQRFGAASITVVQSNPQLLALLKGELRDTGGAVFQDQSVSVVNRHPRLFIEQTREQFDIIQIVTAEGMPAGASGLHSLNEDYLLTVEAFARCYERLSDVGCLSISRGIQMPARDNIRIFATSVAALQKAGVVHPGRHLLQRRNYLAVNTTFFKTPVTEARLASFLSACDDLLMDVDYCPGVKALDLEPINEIPGPPNGEPSYYSHAAQEILFGDSAAFYRSWVYQIEPALDDRPYFNNFFKWRSIRQFIETYGSHWFRRLELGYLVVAVTGVGVILVAFILILLPLLVLRGRRGVGPNRIPVVVHFAAIGFGFMMLEIAYMQKFTHVLGDPMYSVAATLTSLLVFAGLGSILQEKTGLTPVVRIRVASLLMLLVGGASLLVLDALMAHFVRFSVVVRFAVTVVSLFPISFFMGWFFSSAVQILKRSSQPLIPLAWGVNGFASVSAAPLALILAVSIGYSGVVLCALVCYLAAGLVSFLWRE